MVAMEQGWSGRVPGRCELDDTSTGPYFTFLGLWHRKGWRPLVLDWRVEKNKGGGAQNIEKELI